MAISGDTRRILVLAALVCLLAPACVAGAGALTAGGASVDKNHVSVEGSTAVQRSNAYIEYIVGDDLLFTLGTTGGDPSNPNDNNKNLLFGHGSSPWSSVTTIRVDGYNAIYGDYVGTVTQAPTNGTTSSSSAWKYKDVSVTQTLSFVTNPYTGRADVMKIDYLVRNANATASRLVGVRCMLDTELGSNDGAPFRVPGVGAVEYERQYNKSSHNTPQYWQAFDSLTSPTVTAQGTLIGNAATEPSVTQFAAWPNVYSSTSGEAELWNYVIDPANEVTGDSAVTMTWNEVTLLPGQQVEYTTYYGIGSMTGASNADIALTASGPSQLTVSAGAYSPNPFTIVAYVENKKATPLTNVKMDLTLPAGLANVTPRTLYIASIPAGDTGEVSWQVRAASQPAQTILKYYVNASGAQITAPGVGVNRTILIPALSQPDKIGIFRSGTWQLDTNGNGAWNGAATDRQYTGFGSSIDKAVAGDWSGSGKTAIGYQRYGSAWYLDYNANGKWNGSVIDRLFQFGVDDIPVAGDWNGNGKTEIGIFRSGVWYLDYNGNGQWDGTTTDRKYTFGMAGDKPVAGRWNAASTASRIGVFRGNGIWMLDYNGNGIWNSTPQDRQYTFGMTGDKPVVGRWNGSVISQLGIFRGNGTWQLDSNGNGVWNGAATDTQYTFGMTGDQPVAGRW